MSRTIWLFSLLTAFVLVHSSTIYGEGLIAPQGTFENGLVLPPTWPATSAWVLKQENVNSGPYRPDCTAPADHDAADYCLQSRAAEAAARSATYSLIQALMAILGFLLLIFTLIFTRRATNAALESARGAMEGAEAARKAADAAAVANRAWVTAEFRVNRVVKNNYGINLGIVCVLRNIGRSPALNVFVSPRVVYSDYDDELKLQQEVCESLRAAWANIVSRPGRILFPGRTLTVESTGVLPLVDLEAAYKRVIARRAQGRSPMTEEEQVALRASITLGVVGCVGYGFSGSTTMHETRFILTMTNTDTPEGVAVHPVVLRLQDNVEFNVDFVLMQAPYGADAT